MYKRKYSDFILTEVVSDENDITHLYYATVIVTTTIKFLWWTLYSKAVEVDIHKSNTLLHWKDVEHGIFTDGLEVENLVESFRLKHKQQMLHKCPIGV